MTRVAMEYLDSIVSVFSTNILINIRIRMDVVVLPLGFKIVVVL